MRIKKAIQWLEMYANRPVKWDDYSDGSKVIREEAERQIDEAFKMAINALKAQEPIAPVKVNRYMETDENGDWFSPETYDCGNCGVELHGKADYCHLCGRAVKWK